MERKAKIKKNKIKKNENENENKYCAAIMNICLLKRDELKNCLYQKFRNTKSTFQIF